MTKKFITEKEVFAITGRALQTLRNDRFKSKGFPYIKIGKSVRYDEEVVIAIMEKSKVETSSFRTESGAHDLADEILKNQKGLTKGQRKNTNDYK